jgi:hypothetical protein
MPIFLQSPPANPALDLWLKAIAGWLHGFSSTGVLDELLREREFRQLRRYLERRDWDLQILKTWNRCELSQVPLSLPSWNTAGFLLELSGGADYDLSFSTVGCVELTEDLEQSRELAGTALLDYLTTD